MSFSQTLSVRERKEQSHLLFHRLQDSKPLYEVGLNVRLVNSDGTLFQSTHPSWGDLTLSRSLASFICISIHPPLVGWDGTANKIKKDAGLFQSTHPSRGGTTVGKGEVHALIISIHSPLGGWDGANEELEIASCSFQSTHPVWGGTAKIAKITYCFLAISAKIISYALHECITMKCMYAYLRTKVPIIQCEPIGIFMYTSTSHNLQDQVSLNLVRFLCAYMHNFILIVIPEHVKAQAVARGINDTFQLMFQHLVLTIIKNTFENRILHPCSMCNTLLSNRS